MELTAGYLHFLRELQWGRVRVNAERTSGWGDEGFGYDRLQWGRVRVNAESSPVARS